MSKNWIEQNVQTMNSGSFDSQDFSFLENEINDKRIVFLGEATHFDGATFEVRTQIIEYLIEEMYFDVILFEAGMFDLMEANREFQVSNDSESIRKSLWNFWRSKEWESFYAYLEKRKVENKPIEMAGFDAKFSSSYGFDANNYSIALEEVLRQNDPDILNEPNFQEYILIWKDIETGYQKTGFKGALAKLRYKMRKKEKERLRFLSQWVAQKLNTMGETTWAQMIRSNDEGIIAYSDARLWKLILYKKSFVAINNRRDELMADNLKHLLQEVYPDKKVLVIGATYHFMRNNNLIDPIRIQGIPVHKSVISGNILYESLSNEIYTLAFTSYDGFSGLVSENEEGKATKSPGENSLEYQLANQGIAQAFVSMKSSAAEPFFNEGAVIRMLDHKSATSSKQWSKILDGVFFIRTMKPATEIN